MSTRRADHVRMWLPPRTSPAQECKRTTAGNGPAPSGRPISAAGAGFSAPDSAQPPTPHAAARARSPRASRRPLAAPPAQSLTAPSPRPMIAFKIWSTERSATMTTLQRAEAAEHALSQELDRMVVKSVIYTSGEHDPTKPMPRPPDQGKRYLMSDDPRLPKMPDKPTLFDFFRYRFGPSAHLLQSARLAQKNGVGEKVVL